LLLLIEITIFIEISWHFPRISVSSARILAFIVFLRYMPVWWLFVIFSIFSFSGFTDIYLFSSATRHSQSQTPRHDDTLSVAPASYLLQQPWLLIVLYSRFQSVFSEPVFVALATLPPHAAAYGAPAPAAYCMRHAIRVAFARVSPVFAVRASAAMPALMFHFRAAYAFSQEEILRWLPPGWWLKFFLRWCFLHCRHWWWVGDFSFQLYWWSWLSEPFRISKLAIDAEPCAERRAALSCCWRQLAPLRVFRLAGFRHYWGWFRRLSRASHFRQIAEARRGFQIIFCLR